MNAIITDKRTLRAMERAGFIVTFLNTKDRHWTGRVHTPRYVDAGPKLASWATPFTYKGEQFRLCYFDGCMMPFVTRIGAQLPTFV